jgi:hypothetical protein
MSSWAQDSTKTGAGPAAQFEAGKGILSLASGSTQGSSTTYLSNINPGESLEFSYQLNVNPPPSKDYNRLFYYLSYTNKEGKQETAYVHIDASKTPGKISFTVPKDMQPGTKLGFTLHHEKDWEGSKEVASFSNMHFSYKGMGNDFEVEENSNPVDKWTHAIRNSKNPVAQAAKNAVKDHLQQLKDKIDIPEVKALYTKHIAARKVYARQRTQENFDQLKQLHKALKAETRSAREILAKCKSGLTSLYDHLLKGDQSVSLSTMLSSTGTSFTGSEAETSAVRDAMVESDMQSLTTYVDKKLPTPTVALGETAPTTSAEGSGLSNAEEEEALKNDPAFQDLLSILRQKGGSNAALSAAYETLKTDKSTYASLVASGASISDLNAQQAVIKKDSQTLLSTFVQETSKIISAAGSSTAVGSIAKDFSPEEGSLYIAHLELLCSDVMKDTGDNNIQYVNPKHYVPPSVISTDNLLKDNIDAWTKNHGTTGTASSGNPGVSPSAVQDGIVIDNTDATGSDYYNMSQDIETHSSGAGEQYLVAGYIRGSVSNGKGEFLPGGIVVSGDINYDGVHYSPQTYQNSGTSQWQLVYFVVTADKADADINVSINAPAGGNCGFCNLQVIPIGSGNSPQDVQDKALSLYPMPSIAGNPGLGHFPQLKTAYDTGDNLLNWPPSEWKGAPEKSLYPYWSQFGDKSHAYLVNSGDGHQAVSLRPTADVTATSSSSTEGIVPPDASYTYTSTITIPDSSDNAFPGLDIYATDYSTTPATKTLVGHWDPKKQGDAVLTPPMSNPPQPGTYQISYTIPEGIMTNACQLEAQWSGYKGSGAFTVSNPSITSGDPNAYAGINAYNPYDTSKEIYNSQDKDYDASWDFTNGTASGSGKMSDWGMSLVGNDICSPYSDNLEYVEGKGLVMKDTVDEDGSISDAGIQSSFMTAPGQPYSVTTTVTCDTPDSDNQPVFALWVYGESQPGVDDAMSHRSAGGVDSVSECDFELCPPNAEHPNGFFRAVTYAGYDAGGLPHSFVEIPLEDGCNLWDGNPHSITMSINPLADGESSVTWTVKGPDGAETNYTYTSTKEDPGYPIGDNSTYIKIATEQPYGWPGFEKKAGYSQFTISDLSYHQDPLPSTIDPSTLPDVSVTDYSYSMPGKGFAYTPFPTDFFGELED